MGKKNRFEMLKGHNKAEFEKAVCEKMADGRMVRLCAFVNSLEEFLTTSSCSGRIMLLEVDEKESKKEAAFVAKWHRKVRTVEVWKAMQKSKAEEIWFKQEPFIIHIGTNSLENSNRILECMRLAGIKRGGIMVAEQEKFLIELVGTQQISLPVKKSGKALVEKKYLDFVVKRANKKLETNYSRLKLFGRILRQKLR